MQNPWKVILAFIGVFIAGAVFGAFFSLGVGARWLDRHPREPGAGAPFAPAPGTKRNAELPSAPALQVAQLLRRFAEHLELTPAQRERIMPLIQRAVQDFRRQQANTFREDGFILQRLQQDIAKELTPEQRKRLGELQERQRALLRKRLMEWQGNRNLRHEGMPASSDEPAPAASSGEANPKTPGSAPPTTSPSQSTAGTSTSDLPEKKE